MSLPALVDGQALTFIRPAPPETKTLYLVGGSVTTRVTGFPVVPVTGGQVQLSTSPGGTPSETATLLAPLTGQTLIVKDGGRPILLAGAALVLAGGHLGASLPPIPAGTVVNVT